MKHHASAEAANTFWDLAFKIIPNVLDEREKKVPRFVQQRRKMEEDSPEVSMEYCYRNKLTGEIIKYEGNTAPIKRFQNTQTFEKLYEMAFVKVIYIKLSQNLNVKLKKKIGRVTLFITFYVCLLRTCTVHY